MKGINSPFIRLDVYIERVKCLIFKFSFDSTFNNSRYSEVFEEVSESKVFALSLLSFNDQKILFFMFQNISNVFFYIELIWTTYK